MRVIAAVLFMLAIAVPVCAAPNDPEAFSDWFVKQNFEGEEYYKWEAILNALTDGIDRSREAKSPIKDPVSVAVITGKKYHSHSECPGLRNASKILVLDIYEALDRGFERCKICVTDYPVYINTEAANEYFEYFERYCRLAGINASFGLSADPALLATNLHEYDKGYTESLKDALFGPSPNSHLWIVYFPETDSFWVSTSYHSSALTGAELEVGGNKYSIPFKNITEPESFSKRRIVLTSKQVSEILSSDVCTFTFEKGKGKTSITIRPDEAQYLYTVMLGIYDCSFYSDKNSHSYLKSEYLDSIKEILLEYEE